MNSYKNSDQARRMREWNYSRDKFFQSEAYLNARRKALRQERIYAYCVVGCAITVIGVLMFWP